MPMNEWFELKYDDFFLEFLWFPEGNDCVVLITSSLNRAYKVINVNMPIYWMDGNYTDTHLTYANQMYTTQSLKEDFSIQYNDR